VDELIIKNEHQRRILLVVDAQLAAIAVREIYYYFATTMPITALEEHFYQINILAC